MTRRSLGSFPFRPLSQLGVSLLEALVAMAILLVITASVAGLLLSSRRAAWSAGVQTLATALACDKMERLLSLPWFVESSGQPVSDDRTDLSADPAEDDGTGLRQSPAGTLSNNVAGFVDYVDVHGRSLGSGPRPPAAAAFVRRWAIQPVLADPADSLVLSVLVLPVASASRSSSAWARAVRIATIRTRTAR
jgi:hypothetical protein